MKNREMETWLKENGGPSSSSRRKEWGKRDGGKRSLQGHSSLWIAWGNTVVGVRLG